MNRRSFIALAAIAVALRKLPESAADQMPRLEKKLVEVHVHEDVLESAWGRSAWEDVRAHYAAHADAFLAFGESSFQFLGNVRLSKSAHGIVTGLPA